MFERFTDRARRVVVLAQEEARRLNHNYIGTEHVLLGLLHEGHGMAAQALGELGVSLEAVRAQIFEIIGVGQTAPSGHIPFTPRTKKVLELSLREALQLNTDYIGTEHLLLGLIREGEGAGAQVLAQLGGGLEAARAAVLAIHERNAAQEPEDEAVAPGSGSGGERRTVRGLIQARSERSAGARGYAPGTARFPVRVTDPVVPRESEAARLLTVVARRERNNALIVGPSGAGKSALVRELSQLFTANRGPASLGDAEVMEFELLALRGRSDRVSRRSAASIALVEDLDGLLAANEASGGRMVLGLAALADSDPPLVVTATPAAQERLERQFPSLAARFEPVPLPAAGLALSVEVLQALRPGLDEFHRLAITDAALAAAVELGARDPGGRGRALPGAAVDLLDAAAARLAASRRMESAGQDAVLDAEHISAEYEAQAA